MLDGRDFTTPVNPGSPKAIFTKPVNLVLRLGIVRIYTFFYVEAVMLHAGNMAHTTQSRRLTHHATEHPFEGSSVFWRTDTTGVSSSHSYRLKFTRRWTMTILENYNFYLFYMVLWWKIRTKYASFRLTTMKNRVVENRPARRISGPPAHSSAERRPPTPPPPSALRADRAWWLITSTRPPPPCAAW